MLYLWNELHFFAVHRLLHWPPLYRTRPRPASPLGHHDAVLGLQLPSGRVVPAGLGHAARARASSRSARSALLGLTIMSLLLNVSGHLPHERVRPAFAFAVPHSALPQPASPRVPHALRLFARAARPLVLAAAPRRPTAPAADAPCIRITSAASTSPRPARSIPGEPVGNDRIDEYIAPLNGTSPRLKRRILAENGIEHRYYSTGPDGTTRYGAAHMAAEAIRACLGAARLALADVDMLCTGTSGGDATLPGFANMVQGELASPPMVTSSHAGVCAAGLAALAARGDGARRRARAPRAGRDERSAFAPLQALALREPRLRHRLRRAFPALDALRRGRRVAARARAARARIRSSSLGVHLRSFGGDYPVCMQVGLAAGSPRSYLDYESFAAAEADGAYALRQNIRLLPNLFDVAHPRIRAPRGSRAGSIRARIDHFLCHYSSQRFAPVVRELLDKAGLTIPDERWYSNLKMARQHRRRVDLRDARRFPARAQREARRAHPVLRAGVRAASRSATSCSRSASRRPRRQRATRRPIRRCRRRRTIPTARSDPLHAQAAARARARSGTTTARARGARRSSRASPRGKVTARATCCAGWRTGSRRCSRAASGCARRSRNLDDRYAKLRELVTTHAGEEQYDFRILFDDYRRAGGPVDAHRGPAPQSRRRGAERLPARARRAARIRSACSARSTSSRAPASASCRRCCPRSAGS